jgi:ACS family glucarate transporter-like MFS transporter
MSIRYLLILGTFLLSMLLYVDRVCISTAKGEVAGELKFNDTQMGWVFAAFTLGYALFQTPSGWLSDRLGPRRVLTVVVCCWSIFTALTGAVSRLWSMLVVRFLFGVGEAGAFPGMARAIYSWLPMSERGLAQGINFSASRLGAAFAMPGVAWLVTQVGWRHSFLILGGIGFAWALGWYFWFRDDPEDHPGISPSERDFILANRQQASALPLEIEDSPAPPEGPGSEAIIAPEEGISRESSMPAATASPRRLLLPEPRLTPGALLSSVNMWLVMGQYFASNFTFFFCLSWLLPYLSKQYNLSTTQAGWLAMLPFLGGMLGNWVGGGLVDGIYRAGYWQWSRRFPAMLGFLLAAVGLLSSLATDTATAAVLWITLAIFGADMTLSPSWSLCIDIGRRHAGTVSGTMNMAGNIGSFVTSLAFPYLKDWTGSVVPFFLVGVSLNVLAFVAWQFARADRPLEVYG